MRSWSAGKNTRAFVRFDVSSIPAGSTIDSATLTLCPTRVPDDTRTYNVHRVTAGWAETTLTWSNQPAVGGTATDSATTPASEACMTWTITGDVQAWVDGTANNGWRVSDSVESQGTKYWTEYRSREDTAVPSERPTLDVTYTAPAATPTATATPTSTPTPSATATATPLDTGLANCGANAAVTTNSGDNDGFQNSPSNACADGGGLAEDVSSGTNTSTSCSDTGKDRHDFYNYGFSIPGGSAINGIEVRLDAKADSTNGSPQMCAQLSWDGGASWTTTKITPTLTTSQVAYTLGASNDVWGRSWSDTEFSNANFRLRITNVSSFTAAVLQLDWAAVQVTYTAP